jgi:uncharacterized protein with GYD domain
VQKYISLVSFTEEGIKNLKDTCNRASSFTQQAKKNGVIINNTLWTIGRYDIVHFFEAPDDEAAAAVSFALSSMGNVRTETMRAFDFKEMKKIIGNAYELHVAQGSLK